MGYYKQIDGKKYDGTLLEAAEKAVEGRGDGRISKDDAAQLLQLVKDGDAYTDVEKDTVAYIRDKMKWTDEADEWFRTEIRKWAAARSAGADLPESDEGLRAKIDEILTTVRHQRDQWDGAFATFRAMLEGKMKATARDLLAQAARRERLEFQWKLDALLEDTAPPEPPKPSTAPPAEDLGAPEVVGQEVANPPPQMPGAGGPPPAAGQLSMDDLIPIYDDPRGLLIHRHKLDGRWFLTQVDPQTGQPQTMQLQDAQKSQVQTELAGSPYWLEKSWGGPPIVG